MKKNKITIITLICCAICLNSCSKAELQDADLRLSDGWYIQSSATVALDGAQLSTEGTDFGLKMYFT